MPLPAHLARKLAHQRTEQSAQVSASVEPDVEKNNNVLVVAPVPEPTPVEVVPEPVPVNPTPVEVVPEPESAPVEVVPEPVPVSPTPVEPASCCTNGTCTCKPVEPESENGDEKKKQQLSQTQTCQGECCKPSQKEVDLVSNSTQPNQDILEEIKKLSPSQELVENLKKLTAEEFQELLKEI